MIIKKTQYMMRTTFNYPLNNSLGDEVVLELLARDKSG